MPNLNEEERRRDAYYTPGTVAREVVANAQAVPRVVMDPSAGDGSLLQAAATQWPGARIIGLDIDRRQLAITRARNPDWALGRVDMFSNRSRAASPNWHPMTSRVDLMLLNPPFSYRGGRSMHIQHAGENYALTPASAFVGLSISRLTPGGELLALLPAGVLSLERDAEFWTSVASSWEIETVAEFSSTAFRGTRTRSVLVAVRGRSKTQKAAVLDFHVRPHACLELVRGRVPVHQLSQLPTHDQSAPFLHTRDLDSLVGRVETNAQAPARLATKGPFVTVPRVGRALERHIKIVSSPESVVLSDCIFALRSADGTDLASVRMSLLADLGSLQAEYVGGCAPYLTIRRLVDYLSVRGFCCHHVPASSELGQGLHLVGSRCGGRPRLEVQASPDSASRTPDMVGKFLGGQGWVLTS
jgi:hypothetical protein